MPPAALQAAASASEASAQEEEMVEARSLNSFSSITTSSEKLVMRLELDLISPASKEIRMELEVAQQAREAAQEALEAVQQALEEKEKLWDSLNEKLVVQEVSDGMLGKHGQLGIFTAEYEQVGKLVYYCSNMASMNSAPPAYTHDQSVLAATEKRDEAAAATYTRARGHFIKLIASWEKLFPGRDSGDIFCDNTELAKLLIDTKIKM